MIEGFIFAYPETLIMFPTEEAAIEYHKHTDRIDRAKRVALYRVEQVRLIAPDPSPNQTPRDKRLDILEEDANVLGQRLDAEADDPPEPGAA